jgi:sodium--glutamate symport carrier gltS
MSPQLWTLADLGFAILPILFAQVVMVLLWGGIVVFRAMGANDVSMRWFNLIDSLNIHDDLCQ